MHRRHFVFGSFDRGSALLITFAMIVELAELG
jgi:hypothetical protein